jgi:hypothetical protein
MTIRFTFFLSLLFFMLLSCGNESAKVPQVTDANATLTASYAALATDYCTCSAELIALNKKAKHLAAHPDEIKNVDEMSELLLQSEQLSQKQIDCQNTLEEKYKTKIADNSGVLNAIKTACPDLAEFIENAKKTDE